MCNGKNPHYKKAAPMCLYDRLRVEKKEKEPEFIARQERRPDRKEAARKAVAVKREKILTWVDELKIEIPALPRESLFRRAIYDYNDFHRQFADYRPAGFGSDPEFLYRIARNYVRHNLTDYEARLEALFGKVGTEAAYERLKTRINRAIRKTYGF
jgi:hypothetical protein